MSRIHVLTAIALCLASAALAQTTNDLVFIHHSCGYYWLANSLDAALVAKDYIDERNDIYYGTVMTPDAGRPDSLAPIHGDNTNMNHWIRWFNDYFNGIKTHGCADGVNEIIMFKSCYTASFIFEEGTEPGDPFSVTQHLDNYKAVYRYPTGVTSYSNGGYTYKPLEEIFAENPDTLFIAVSAPPLCYTATIDAWAHNARVFNEWLVDTWLPSYKANTGLNNVAIFNWFDFLANPDDHATGPNRLKEAYGGTTTDSHPNATANSDSTAVFATNPDNFIDAAWNAFKNGASLPVAVAPALLALLAAGIGWAVFRRPKHPRSPRR